MNEQRIWDALLNLTGGNAFGAAGLMGNLYAESALNPRNLQQSFEKKLGYTDDSYTEAVDGGAYAGFVHDGAGYGLAQWTYWSRKKALLVYARSCHASIGDLDMQLEFLGLELRTNYSWVLDKLKNAKSVRAASDAVLLHYERPKDQSEKVKTKRAGFGQRYYDTYATQSRGDQEIAPTTNNGGDTMAEVKIGSARIDENGNAHGGRAGDQTGREVSTQNWYRHKKGWRVLRAKDPAAAEKIAQAMQWACDSKLIGYDQYQRETLRNAVMPLGWDIRRLNKAVETDCSALVRVCCGWAFQKDLGAGVSYFNTTSMCAALLKTGLFTELTGAKYTDSSDYLRRGDILCTKTQGHTVVVLSNGSKAGAEVAPVTPKTPDAPKPEGLSKGDHGSAVERMQKDLLIWDADCLPRYGADGDFGEETEAALKAFQAAEGLPVTGVYDERTRKVLQCVGEMQSVTATGNVNVRSAPGTSAIVLGVLKKGQTAPYQGETREWGGRDWYLIIYQGKNGWVSSKYAEVTVG